uniref:Uncharacterized protein n=1 Tax=Sphaerodactylus townsendi TaxID=933632 RepID=A0ACB8ECV1_9SAUR
MSQAAAACRSSGSRSGAMKVKKGGGGGAAGAAAPACTEDELRGRRAAGISPEDVLGLQKITSGVSTYSSFVLPPPPVFLAKP